MQEPLNLETRLEILEHEMATLQADSVYWENRAAMLEAWVETYRLVLEHHGMAVPPPVIQVSSVH